jgi:uncharacterized phage protein (TIGR02218 family)
MSFVERDLVTAAFCWRLERRDGAALGFTSHDRDLHLGGLLYRAAPGMLPSAVTLTDGFEIDRLDIAGALTADAIIADDLACGRWDGAALTVFLADWEDPAPPTIAIARGELGEVTSRGDAFEAELRGPTALLERPVAEQTSPDCRAMLGDKRCRVDMAGRTRLTRIVAIGGECEVTVAGAAAGNAYAYGRLRWIGGRNSGLESADRKIGRGCDRAARGAAFSGFGRRSRPDFRGLRQEPHHVQHPLCQRRQFPRRAASARARFADQISRGLRLHPSPTKEKDDAAACWPLRAFAHDPRGLRDHS